MSADHNELEDEKPLDPEMEKVRRKMVRLLGVSLGIMFIGIMAVLAGVIYKINEAGEEEAALEANAAAPAANIVLNVPANLEVVLPLGFNVEDVDLDGQNAAIFGNSADGQNMLLIVDLSKGAVISEITLRD